MAAAVNGIKGEMKGGFIVMKKNVKRFVKHDDMAMLVAAGSLAGCGGGGRRFHRRVPQRQRLIQAVHPVVR